MAAKAMDELKDAKSIDFSTRYKAVAKSYVGVQKWTAPAPAGHDLEIMPETDMSQVKAGDLVKFKVTFKGQIRVPTPGAWVASTLVKKEVTPDNELKDLAKKCRSIFYGSTVSFTAKP